MRSWRARLLMLVTALAMLLAVSGSAAMADVNFGHHGDRVFFVDDNNVDFFDEDLDTIDVGNLECLVEDGDDVDFCVNEDTGNVVFH